MSAIATTITSPEVTHGRRAYDAGLCHCGICRRANTEHVRAVRARNRARVRAGDQVEHGTALVLDAGCRCPDCRALRQLRYEAQEGYRSHWWRDLVCETYRSARDAWEALRESDAPVWGVAGTSHSGVAAHQLTDAEFRWQYPAPTLRTVMRGLSHAMDLRDGLPDESSWQVPA